jgi:hypothetical protein
MSRDRGRTREQGSKFSELHVGECMLTRGFDKRMTRNEGVSRRSVSRVRSVPHFLLYLNRFFLHRHFKLLPNAQLERKRQINHIEGSAHHQVSRNLNGWRLLGNVSRTVNW